VDRSPAILIHRYKLTETSLIVHWCCPEVGRIKTVAKGALRPKSSFAGQLDLFLSADIRFTRSRKSDLHTLTEVSWTEPRLPLRQSYARVLAATYLVKLVEQTTEPEAPIAEVFSLLTKALDYLTTHEPSLALIERFEKRLAADMGVGAPGLKPAAALQMALHHALPVQRKQLIAEMERVAAATTSPHLPAPGPHRDRAR
jgi:DNA repair protein RecO (recombination protein O)